MQADQNKNTFYVVSMSKFTVLYLCTMGLYGFYWVFKNWQLLGRAQERNTLPILRCVLKIIFVPLLCLEIKKEERKREQNYPWNPTFLAVLFVAAEVIASWIITLVIQEDLSQAWNLIQLPYLLVTYYVFYKLQLVVNRMQGDAFGEQNTKYTAINHAWIIYGMVQWLGWLHGVYLIFSGDPSLAPPAPPS